MAKQPNQARPIKAGHVNIDDDDIGIDVVEKSESLESVASLPNDFRSSVKLQPHLGDKSQIG